MLLVKHSYLQYRELPDLGTGRNKNECGLYHIGLGAFRCCMLLRIGFLGWFQKTKDELILKACTSSYFLSASSANALACANWVSSCVIRSSSIFDRFSRALRALMGKGKTCRLGYSRDYGSKTHELELPQNQQARKTDTAFVSSHFRTIVSNV